MALTEDLKRLVLDATRQAEGPYISIFMAVHPNETNLQLDKAQYKNLVAAAQKAFTDLYPKKDWPAYAEKFALIGLDRILGRNGYRGMAVIASKDHVFRYDLTATPDDESYVSDNLYILPIIKDAQYNFDYDLLSLNKSGFGLYQARNGLINQVMLPKSAPTDLLQTLTEADAQDSAAVHAGNDIYAEPTLKEPNAADLTRYFKIVDQYIRQQFTLAEHMPLVLLGADVLQDQFRGISKNGMLADTVKLTKQPSKLDQGALNDLKDQISQQFVTQAKAQVHQDLDDARSGNREVSGVDNVVQAVVEGRIKQVLIRENTVEHGVIDLDLRIDTQSPQAAKHNLLNDIAVVTLAFGGQVHVLTDEEMPIGQSVLGLMWGKLD